jgi:L-aspartate oxidase
MTRQTATETHPVKQADVLIIGSGISGLLTALKLAEAGLSCLLVTKTQLMETNSRYAQGGIAAFLPFNEEDSLALHVQDTLAAGAGLCDKAVVHDLLAEGADAINDLLELGVPFDKTENNDLALTREAAHSVRRIIHAGGDATGQSVETTLVARVQASRFIEVLEYLQVSHLLHHTDGSVCGAWAVALPAQQWVCLQAKAVIFATGGLGQLFQHTTNPSIATGDGLALAAKAGAHLRDMEFIQFHPTAFYHEGKCHFLISEAFRGEGGRLVNSDGASFANRYHPDGELAPRDVVTRAIFSEMKRLKQPCVYLDMTHLDAAFLTERFPSINQFLLKRGLDMCQQLIPVAPAAHYLMGGLEVTPNGETSVAGLYAVGEVTRTGLHGANRLASNSLLECLVLARRVAKLVAERLKPKLKTGRASHPFHSPPFQLAYAEEVPPFSLKERQQALQELMWLEAGIVRTERGLHHAEQTLKSWLKEAEHCKLHRWVPDGLELVNQLWVALAIVQAALKRKTSIGAHFIEATPAISALK